MLKAASVVLPTAENLSGLNVYVVRKSHIWRNLKDDNKNEFYRKPEDFNNMVEEINSETLKVFKSHSRSSFCLHPYSKISFGTFFNSFPVSYWLKYTEAKEVTLVLKVRKCAVNSKITLKASNSEAEVIYKKTHVLTTGENVHNFIFNKVQANGGFFWFELNSGDAELEVEDAKYFVEDSVLKKKNYQVSFAITTFNNPKESVSQLKRINENEELQTFLKKVILVDQGTDKVKDAVDFLKEKTKLKNKLQLIEQPNLGGSGGFARGQLEAVCKGVSGNEEVADAVIMMDDDVLLEPEAILKTIIFASCCKSPSLVGAHMFSLESKSILHNSGEFVDEKNWIWKEFEQSETKNIKLSLSLYNYVDNPYFSRLREVTHNGWWMCLIPKEVIEKVGLSFPGFIKWDDVEFGLRAKKAGFSVVTLPGSLVWHLSWEDKNDLWDWQAYFHQRNQLITNLIHSSLQSSGRLLSNNKRVDKSYLVSLHYGAVNLHFEAIKDVLEGPSHLHSSLLSKAKDVRELLKNSDDGKVYITEKNPSLLEKYNSIQVFNPSFADSLIIRRFKGFFALILNRFNLVSAEEKILSNRQAGWWESSYNQKVIVFSSDGSSAKVYNRNHSLYISMNKQNNKSYSNLKKNWKSLKKTYRDSFSELVSPKTWAKTFKSFESN